MPSPMPYSFIALVQLSLVAISAISLPIFLSAMRQTLARTIVLTIIAFYYTVLYGFIGFWIYTRNLPDPYLILKFGFDVQEQLQLIGTQAYILVLSILLVFLGCFLVVFIGQSRLGASLRPQKWTGILLLAIFIVMGLLRAPAVYGFYHQSLEGRKLAEAKGIVTMTDTLPFTTRSNENVFIVLLESTNALALSGKLSIGKKSYSGSYMPILESLGQNGIFFPFFFSNQQQTLRAMESILCGIPGNVGDGLWERVDEIPADRCLPNILKKDNYTTLFFSANPNPDSFHKQSFAGKVGFEQQHYGDIMTPEDRKSGWGYDDCDYYKRTFQFLHNAYPSPVRKLIFLEVAAAHAGFGKERDYESVAPFQNPKNYLEKYLDTMAMQDTCLSTLYEEYQQYDPENSHLFILGDHPFGLQKGYARFDGRAENFLVPLAYIPPRNRLEEFHTQAVSHDFFSQSDITPTILELLNGHTYQNSFAFALRKNSKEKEVEQSDSTNYEHCHFMHSIYDGATTAIVQGMQKFTYSHADGITYTANLSNDMLEKYRYELSKIMSFDDFLNKFMCSRFRTPTFAETGR
ncbi:MAG: sulfatase-like hydrolase/transferase [Candidatus Peribacteraceae bacterium]|nr:sulfatase-like hydrolase/transferase [Candidatus Peribacteraceae bacterium]